MSEPEEKCIYCDQPNYFTDEHIFPAGLGGDDSRYLLKAGVCGDCNNGFSGIESTFQRRSVVGLARVIHQAKNRDGEPPTFDPVESHILDEEGRFLEAGYVAGFDAQVLPQIFVLGETITTTSPNKEALLSFLKQTTALLSKDELKLIEKNRSNTQNRFFVSRYRFNGKAYHFITKEGAEKPPKGVIWIEALINQKVDADACLYQRTGKQVAIKSKSTQAISGVLGSIRRTLPGITARAESAQDQVIQQPIVSTTCLGWPPDCDRVVAKIGINFLAKDAGLETARHPDLDAVKAFIFGKSEAHRTNFLDEETKAETFGSVPEGHHCVIISYGQTSTGRLSAVIAMHLYGGIGLTMQLSNDLPDQCSLKMNYYLINYTQNTISKYDVIAYQTEFNSDYVRQFAKEHGVGFQRFMRDIGVASSIPPELWLRS